MEPAVTVALCWMLFALSHVGLATGRVRAALVARLGVWGFTGVFSLVAAGAFALLIRSYAIHRLDGTAGLALGTMPVLRIALMTVIVAGVTLATASLAVYPRSPMALFGETVRAPYGLERITRHPFFIGLVLIAVPHALLATRLVGTVFALGLAAVPAVGMWHQDRKLLALRGASYADYLAGTSAIPFGAILAGRQHLVWRELPMGAVSVGLALAWGLRSVHDAIFAYDGAWIIGGTVGGALILSVQAWRRARRQQARVRLTPRTI